MKTIKGPGIFLAQFLRDQEPFNNLEGITSWVASLGYKGIQIPTWDSRVIDLDKAASSKDYCDEFKETVQKKGVDVIELASYLQGQVMAMNLAYEEMFQPFYPRALNDQQRVEWARQQLIKTIDASANLGTRNISVLSGGLAWHMVYPWPQRPDGIIDEAFKELAKRWMPVLQYATEKDITFGYELHPGSDVFDGATFESFLEATSNNPAVGITYDPSHFLLQQLDYLAFIDIYAAKINAFHVKDAEFRPNGRMGLYGGYKDWPYRPGRFRSIGDGQVDFKAIFTLLTEKDYNGWAILEWECCVKSPQQGAREAAPFIKNQIIEATDYRFDDFAGSSTNTERNRRILGLDRK
ncbi:MAG: sugar phosphate isomerase/epimerase family protein [Candidatus Cyclobacteriaceae bacterium M3_2C_046]